MLRHDVVLGRLLTFHHFSRWFIVMFFPQAIAFRNANCPIWIQLSHLESMLALLCSTVDIVERNLGRL